MTADLATLTEAPLSTTLVPRLELAEWRHRFGVTAGITTAAGGADLGLFGEGHAGRVMHRWLDFATTMQPAFPRFALARQVHGTRIAAPGTGSGWTIHDETDGHVTDTAGVLLAVTVADCVPVYLFNRRSGKMGLLHAGWKGIAAGIVEAGVLELTEAGKTVSPDIVIHCGVAICGACYEVGSEVAHALEGVASTGKQRVDLRRVVARRAMNLGVTDVTVSTWCAAHHRDMFFSHRASGGAPGRMAAFLGRPLA